MKFQNILRAGVAVMCMTSGAAYAQFGGSVGVGGQRDGGWGFGTDVMMPFFTDGLSHMMYGMAGANYRKNDPEFSLGIGYRALPGYGEMMVGGHISAETWRADKNNWFYGATAGLELVVGPVSFGVNGYAPLGKSRQSIKGTEYGQPVLVDRTPGSCNPGPARVCDLVIENYGKRHSVNNWGGDVHVAYRLPFLEDIDIEITGGAHLFKRRSERDVRGFSGGVDFLVPFGENVLMQANVKLRHETKGGRGTDALFGFGISYQFGGAGEGTTTYLRRKLMQTPERMNPRNRMQEQASVLVGREGAINADNPANVAISQVRFINRDTMNPGMVFNTAPQHSVVVYDGSKGVIDVSATQNVGASNVQVIGGGTVMNLRGATSGRSFTFTMDGSRPTINQTNMANNVFVVDGKTDVVFRNLDVLGGASAFRFINAADGARLSNLTSSGASTSYSFSGSKNAQLDNLKSVDAKTLGLEFVNASHGGQATGIYVNGAVSRGVDISSSNNVLLNNVEVVGIKTDKTKATGIGIRLANAQNASLTKIDVRYIINNAIVIDNGSTDAKLTGVTVVDADGRGIVVSASNGGMFKDITVDKIMLRGFEVTNSDSIKFEDVRVSNTGQGAMAMQRDGIVFNNSKNAELKNVSVSTTGGAGMVLGSGIMFTNNSTGAKIEGANIKDVKGGGLVFDASGSATVKNVTIVNAGLNGILIGASKDTRIENAQIDQTATGAGRGVVVSGSDNVTLDGLVLRGRNTQQGVSIANSVNITVKNTKTSGWLTAYTLTGMATTTINPASTGNTSTDDKDTCDGTNDIVMGSPKLSVTRITGMMTSNVNCD